MSMIYPFMKSCLGQERRRHVVRVLFQHVQVRASTLPIPAGRAEARLHDRLCVVGIESRHDVRGFHDSLGAFVRIRSVGVRGQVDLDLVGRGFVVLWPNPMHDGIGDTYRSADFEGKVLVLYHFGFD